MIKWVFWQVGVSMGGMGVEGHLRAERGGERRIANSFRFPAELLARSTCNRVERYEKRYVEKIVL